MSEGKKGFTRREVVLGTLATFFQALTNIASDEKQIEKEVISVLSSNTNVQDGLLKAARVFGDERENSQYRPIDVIVSEGITNYQKNSGNQAFFTRSELYKNFDYYKDSLSRNIDSIGVIPKSPNEMKAEFEASLPPKLQRIYKSYEENFGSFSDLLQEGSGMYDRFLKEGSDDKEGTAKSYFDQARFFVEGQALNNNIPISASAILEFFLGKNSGDISLSLTDTYLFLKFAARNNFDNGEYTGNNVSWMRNNILDEYGFKSYNDLSATYDIPDQEGEPYHTWNAVAGLVYFPRELVELGVIYLNTGLSFLTNVDKTQSDLLALSRLQNVEGVLSNYAPR